MKKLLLIAPMLLMSLLTQAQDFGCTDPSAINFDPFAIFDDGSCMYNIPGCTDPAANNYDPAATMDNGTCMYDILGCTNPIASNYNALATIDDGSCTILGCTNPLAINFNGLANQDDGSCIILGCTNPLAANFNPLATQDDGTCDPITSTVNEASSDINVFPNPIEGSELNISGDADQVVIKDLQGREVINQILVEQLIDVNDLTDGVYVVSLYKKGQLISTQTVTK